MMIGMSTVSAGHLVQAGLELGARGRARRVGQVRIVFGARHPAAAGKDIRHVQFLWNEDDLYSNAGCSALMPQVPSPRVAVTIRPCAAGPVLLTALVLACCPGRRTAPSRSDRQPSRRRSSTAATTSFPPTNISTRRASREGFNIHLIRALAREAGMSIEIRLGPREERMSGVRRRQDRRDVPVVHRGARRPLSAARSDVDAGAGRDDAAGPGRAIRTASTICGACASPSTRTRSITCCWRRCRNRGGRR